MRIGEPFVVALLVVLACVPRALVSTFAEAIGRFYHAGKRDAIIDRVRLVFGDRFLSPAGIRDFWRAHLRHVGLTVLDLVRVPSRSNSYLLERIHLDGEEHLHNALAKGRGAVLFINHVGSPIAIGAGLGMRGYDLTMVGNSLDIVIGDETITLPLLERLLRRICRRGDVKRALLGDRLPQVMSAALARNGLFAMFVDFPVVQKHNVWLPFGAARMRVNVGPALLALRQRSPILFVSTYRDGPDRHVIRLAPLSAGSEQSDSVREGATALTASALRALEAEIRQHPAQWWFWSGAHFASAGAAW